MKRCTRCNQYYPHEMFDKAGIQSGRQKFRSECKKCKKKRDKKYHSRPEVAAKLTERANRYKKIRKDYVIEILKKSSCVDCGESDFRVLEFDHVKGEKVASIAQMVGRHFSLEAIKAEIDKCEVRCANCHRKVTAQRGNWSILDYMD